MVILRPILLAARNRFRKSEAKGEVVFRDSVLVALALGIMSCGYIGTQWLLNQLEGFLSLAYLSPIVPLVLVLLVLTGMLLISTIVNAVGSFYLSEDLDLLLASPISPAKFFVQRLTGVILGTSTISLVFMLPVFAAYFMKFHQGFRFVLFSVAALIPYFLIPGSLAFIVATILVLFVPLRRSKIFLGLFVILLLVCIWFGIDLVRLIFQARASAGEVYRVVRFFAASEIPWMPSTWIGELLSIQLGITQGDVVLRFIALYGAAGAMISASYLVFVSTYMPAYSSMKNHRVGRRFKSRGFMALSARFPREDRQWLTVATKDLKLLSRDMSQLFQGILLMGIFLIYIYNLSLFAGFSTIGPQDKWWTNFLFVSNFSMSAFISTALCTRFVFPSISLEGRTFPLILLKAPYPIDRYVRGKFFFWYGIVAIVHSLVVGLGTFASGGQTVEIITSVVCSWVMCYSLVGLAVGMGAMYSRFDWESVSQLAVGFGNIIFMLSASALILLNIGPIWVLFQYITWSKLAEHVASAVVVTALFCAGNFLIGYFSLKRGIRVLSQILS